jgi:hypothetical protein
MPASPADAGGIGQGEAGVQTSSSLGVGALALLPDSSRVYVGASAADDFLTALDIDLANGAFVIPAGGGRIALEPKAIGIDHLRLSVNPFAPAPITLADGSQMDFLYAFARDGSVRVVKVSPRPEQECDVNVQPDLVGLPANTGCLPVSPTARRPLAQGPGIRIPTLAVRTAAPAIPRDIAIIALPVSAAGISTNPQSLAGQFAFLLASNDAVYILNLAPKTLLNGEVASEPNTLTHSFREVRSTNQYTADTLALSSTPPLRTPVTTDLLFPTTPILSTTSGPRLEEVENDSTSPAMGNTINATTNYWANFPYQATYVSREFTIAWEAALPGTARSSGTLRSPTDANSPAGALEDVGADFCAKGVLPGDLVVLPGCTADTDCSPQDSFSCRQPAYRRRTECGRWLYPLHGQPAALRGFCSQFDQTDARVPPGRSAEDHAQSRGGKRSWRRYRMPAHRRPSGIGDVSRFPVATGVAERNLQALRKSLWLPDTVWGDNGGCRPRLPPRLRVREHSRFSRASLARRHAGSAGAGELLRRGAASRSCLLAPAE